MAKKRTHGEGTIYQREDDGRWVAQIRVNGKRYTYSNKDREAVLRWLQEKQAAVLRGEFVPPSDITIEMWLKEWLEIYKKPNISENTYRSYAGVIHNHIIPSLGNVPLQRLRPIHLQDLYNRLQQEGKARTAAIAHIVLHSALGQATKESIITKNVAELVEAPKHRAPKSHALTVEEVQRFLEAASTHAYYPAIVLSAVTGLRRSEVLGLRWQDINFEEGMLYIRQAVIDYRGKVIIRPTKTESGARTVPVPSFVLDLLKEHRQAQEEAARILGWDEVPELVFTSSKGTPINPRNYNRAFTEICKKAGLEGVSPHVLRHTFATRLLEAGVNPRIAQELLGHAQASTTMNIYSHVLPGLKRQVIQQVEEIAAKSLPKRCQTNEK